MGKEKQSRSIFLEIVMKRREILKKFDDRIKAVKIPEIKKTS